MQSEDRDTASLTLEDLRVVLRESREEERSQRRAELREVLEEVGRLQQETKEELRREFQAEFKKLREEIQSVKAEATTMGGSTFVERVLGGTEPSQVLKPQRVEEVITAAGSAPNAYSTPSTRPSPNTLADSPAQAEMKSSATTVGRPSLLPREFDGKIPWRRYSLQFEAVSRANGWDDELKALYLATSLRGTALTFYEALHQRIREDYGQLQSALENRFGCDHQQTIAHVQLRSRTQRERETLPEFATEIQRLTNLTFGDCTENARDRISLEQFLDGIADLSIQERVRDVGPHTLQEALQIAVRVEANHAATRAARRHIRTAYARADSPSRRGSSAPPRPTFTTARQDDRSSRQNSSPGNDQELAPGARR